MIMTCNNCNLFILSSDLETGFCVNDIDSLKISKHKPICKEYEQCKTGNFKNHTWVKWLNLKERNKDEIK